MNGDLVRHGASINSKNATPEQMHQAWKNIKSIMN
jgi:hypothetical protein